MLILIKFLIKKTNFNIISIDNYSSGYKKNHINNKKIKYIKSHTKNISKILKKKKQYKVLFHLGEFSRIYQSFLKMDECINSNVIGTNEVFNFCFKNNIKLIYSATSATIGNKGNDKNLSPYAFTKAKNLEMLENLKKWFNFKFEIIYFYNVYGPLQISQGSMATVIGIFENQYKNKTPLTVVKPGSQSEGLLILVILLMSAIRLGKKINVRHYSISSKESYTILEVAKMFNSKFKLLPARRGERFASALTSMNLSNKVHKIFGKTSLKKYINNIVKII